MAREWRSIHVIDLGVCSLPPERAKNPTIINASVFLVSQASSELRVNTSICFENVKREKHIR